MIPARMLSFLCLSLLLCGTGLARPAAAAAVWPEMSPRWGAISMGWAPGPSGMATTVRTARGDSGTTFDTLTGGLAITQNRPFRVVWSGDTDDDTGFSMTLDRYDFDGIPTDSVTWNVRYCTKSHARTGRVMVAGERIDCPSVELRGPHFYGDSFQSRLIGFHGAYKLYEEGEPYPTKGRIDTSPGNYVFTVTPTSSTSSGSAGFNIVAMPVPAAGWLLAGALGTGALLGRRRRA